MTPIAIIPPAHGFHVYWMTNMRCNYDCSYCFPGSHDNITPIPEIDKLLSAAKKFVDYKDDSVQGHITLTGGEPFIVKGVDLLVKYLYDNNFNVSVITNGSARYKVYEKCIEFLEYLLVSWHFEHADDDKLKGLLLDLYPHKSRIVVHIMDHVDYPDRVESAINFCEDNNLDYVIKGIRIYADGKETPMKVVRTNNDDDVVTHNNVGVLTVDDKLYSTHTYELVSGNRNNFKGWDCNIGVNTLAITHNGDITKAVCGQDGIVGNIFDDDVISLTSQPVICGFEKCMCMRDINVAAKTAPGYSKYLDHETYTKYEIDDISRLAINVKMVE